MKRLIQTIRQASRRLADERANALVEFALVAPLLFVIVFGMIDFGKAFNYWLDENHLAAQGARLAAVSSTAPGGTCPGGGTPGSLLAYIKCNADTSELRNNATVCVSFPDSNTHASHPVTISVSTTYTWLPIIGSLLPSPTTSIAGTATMRLEADSTLTAGCA
jgi:Flp pilus assembly protein TadG